MGDIDARLDRSERAADEMEEQGWHESAKLVRETAKDIRQLHEMFRPLPRGKSSWQNRA